MPHADRHAGKRDLWRYNLSEHKNSRLAYGKIIVPGHVAALRRACLTHSPKTRHDMRPPDVSSPDRPGSYASRGPAPAAAAAHGVPRRAAAGPRRNVPDVARPGVSEAAFWRPWPPGPAWHSRDGHVLADVGRLGDA